MVKIWFVVPIRLGTLYQFILVRCTDPFGTLYISVLVCWTSRLRHGDWWCLGKPKITIWIAIPSDLDRDRTTLGYERSGTWNAIESAFPVTLGWIWSYLLLFYPCPMLLSPGCMLDMELFAPLLSLTHFFQEYWILPFFFFILC